MSIQSKLTGFETYLDVIKKTIIYFHYHQKCQDITDNRGDIELNPIRSKHCIYLNLIRIVSVQSKSTGFETPLDVFKKKMIYFHYHQKCQDITDNAGDIELDLIQSSQKYCIYLKLIIIVSIQSKSTGFETYLDVFFYLSILKPNSTI